MKYSQRNLDYKLIGFLALLFMKGYRGGKVSRVTSLPSLKTQENEKVVPHLETFQARVTYSPLPKVRRFHPNQERQRQERRE